MLDIIRISLIDLFASPFFTTIKRLVLLGKYKEGNLLLVLIKGFRPIKKHRAGVDRGYPEDTLLCRVYIF